jgi:hypothetical protein
MLYVMTCFAQRVTFCHGNGLRADKVFLHQIINHPARFGKAKIRKLPTKQCNWYKERPDSVLSCMQQAQASWEEEAMERIANLARSAAPAALPAIQQALTERLRVLELAERPPVATLEQLWWLLRVAARVLADSGKGEAPLVPLEISTVCRPPLSSAGIAVSEITAALCKVCYENIICFEWY